VGVVDVVVEEITEVMLKIDVTVFSDSRPS